MTKAISILGSTGSVGVQALSVCQSLELNVVALTANKNIDLIEKQAREFCPEIISVSKETDAIELSKRLAGTRIDVLYGSDGLNAAATISSADTVLTAIVGIAGLWPTLAAIAASKKIALANKETLVAGGRLVIDEAQKYSVDIIPVDSEHSAIFQSLQGNSISEIERIIITASGGPFRGFSKKQLTKVTVEDALINPNWVMGNKITIDSATLMNKGFEVIEAAYLFGIPAGKIECIVHPQSIIHSMVEYCDSSIIAQMGLPNMMLPIQYALTYPKRSINKLERANFEKISSLTFEKPDTDVFPCLRLAYDALKEGGNATAIINSANEAAVELFLNNQITFVDIPFVIEKALNKCTHITNPQFEDIILTDIESREFVRKEFKK
jgi:1-deoxy-D-xylulose-5-phosphate reductoisomerase